HPVMRCHPVTPMDEADLRRHLMRQTRRQIGLVDILSLQNGDTDRAFEAAVSKGAQFIVFDGLDEASLRECARLLWHRPPGFAVGSSGLTYALIWFWRACGWIPPAPEPRKAEVVDRLIVLSGSCSPVGERQIRWAMEDGFASVRLDAARLAEGDGGSREAAVRQGMDALAEGRSLVLYSALGHSDTNPSIQRDELGRQMGLLLRDLLLRSGVRRAVIAGGDTSSHAGRQLGISALTFYAPLSPGAPLCRAHSDARELDGIQLVFKGGQVGPEHFFGMALTGES
ncbi:MAG: four-carbon acid sugar kinase family protein, partial [Pseudomonadota bacterium]